MSPVQTIDQFVSTIASFTNSSVIAESSRAVTFVGLVEQHGARDAVTVVSAASPSCTTYCFAFTRTEKHQRDSQAEELKKP